MSELAPPPSLPWSRGVGLLGQPMADPGVGLLGSFQGGPQGLLDALALTTTPVPVVGDVAGLAADAYRFATDPESRTPGNAAWAALGLMPFVPALSTVGKAADALDMSQEARMARAKEQGFDVETPVYHGTDQVVNKFNPGRASRAEQANFRSVHMAEDPEFANLYASKPGGNVTKAFIAKDGVIDGTKLIKIGSKEEEILRDLLKGTGIKPYVSDGLMPPLQGYLDQVSPAKAEKVLAKHGVKGVKYSARYGNLVPGGMTVQARSDAYAMLDPSQIRSIHAAFDPAKRNSADLLASIAAAGLFGGTAARLYGDDKQ